MNAPRLLLACLFSAAALHAATLPESRKIDQLLAQDWQKAGLQPNLPASDVVLVRRLYLDIAGRIPTIDEAQAYTHSQDPLKRAKLIDALLASDGYTSHMFNYWADVLRLTDNVKGRITAEAYEEWLKKQLKANVPYDQFVKSLLTTEGGVWDSGSIGFWQRDENKLDHLAYTVQVFLGTSIVCAQCHNHPFDKWSQMDYYHMAAFTYGMDTKSRGVDFKDSKSKSMEPDKKALQAMSGADKKAYRAKLQAEKKAEEAKINKDDMQQVKRAMQDVMKPLRYTSAEWQDARLPSLPADYKYPDGKPGEKVGPKTLFGQEAVIKPGETRLDAFADWMTSPNNPRFTTVIANRMWKKAFGVGLIEPVDELTDSTVASNPALMDYLNELMVTQQYSLKSFLRVLYNTDTYQRVATTQEVPLGEVYHFTGPILRRMSAEQIWDSFVTLSKGNVDNTVDDENARLHQYLGDLSTFLGTVKSKGAEGLVQIAKEGRAKLDANQRRIEVMKVKLAADKAKGIDTTAAAKALAREASSLRKASEKDILVALLGQERADDLRRGYRPEKAAKDKRPTIDPKTLESMTKEQRKEFVKSYQRNSSGKDGMGLTSRASEQPSPARPGTFLRTFGQSDREQIQNASDEASVPQALTLLNGPAADVINNTASKLNQAIAHAATPAQKIAILYEALLSRAPTAKEQAVLDSVIAERGDKAVADVTHALLTGSQFLFIQ
jgi:hypothetical protein